MVGQPVGALVELGEAHRRVLKHQGGLVRSAGHLGLDELGERRRRHVEGGVVPGLEHLVALLLAQDVDLAQGKRGVGGDAGEQHLQVGGHALDGGGVEQVGVVADPDRQPLAP